MIKRKRTKRAGVFSAAWRRFRKSAWLRASAATVMAPALFVWYAYTPRSLPLPDNVVADRVVVEKALRKLTLMSDGHELKTYYISLGDNPEGHKSQEGDERTPEGVYVIDHHNPQSQFHLSLHISYPDAHDRARAAAMGVDPGDNIVIHGLPNGRGWLGHFYQLRDWTDGCIALTDTEIEEIFRAVPNGTPIEIRP